MKAYIGIGANVGDRLANILKALQLLADIVKIGEISAVYETKPEGYSQQPDFLNCVVGVETHLEPAMLLRKLKHIEKSMGRTLSFHNAPRIIDLDILLAGDEIVDREDLKIPHPRMHERIFVLAPLCDIAPQLIHPIKRMTVQELLSQLQAGGSIYGEIREFTRIEI